MILLDSASTWILGFEQLAFATFRVASECKMKSYRKQERDLLRPPMDFN